MDLVNFKFGKPSVTTELVGLGKSWDLHSFANFKGISFLPESDEVVLEWQIPEGVENPWGSKDNTNILCRLVFKKVTFLQMSERDYSIPISESKTLENVSMIDPSSSEFPQREEWADNSDFHLLFTFCDGRALQIASQSARLEA